MVLGSASGQMNSFFSKTFSGLPTHNMIFYTFTFWAIDSWDVTQDYFRIAFDSYSATLFTYDIYRFPEYLCGQAKYPDLRNNRIFGTVSHSILTLTFKLTSLMDGYSYDESFGIREFNMLFATASGIPNNYCGLSYTGLSSTDQAYQCACPEGYYPIGSGCAACHANCASCFGGGNTKCYQCKPGASFISNACTTCSFGCAVCSGTGENQCQACLTGFYLFNNANCLPSCPSPLIQTLGCVNTCSSPCPAGTFYNWDTTCVSSCNFPLQQNTILGVVNTCTFPCKQGLFLYADGTCSTSCYAPYNQAIYKGKNFCNLPCATNQYSSWNGTCTSVCLPPLVIQANENQLFCVYPCTINQTLYWNGSCITNCTAPLVQTTINGDLYCNFPCKSYEVLYWDGSCAKSCRSLLTVRTEGSPRPRTFCDFTGSTSSYLYWNGTYLSTCDFPLVQEVFKSRTFCNYPCNGTSFLYWNGSCLATCPSIFTTRVQGGVNFCDYPCSTSSYLYTNGSCISTCIYPYTQYTEGTSMTRNFCKYGCNSTQFLYWNGTCADNCTAPLIQAKVGSINYCRFPCDYNEFLSYNGSCVKNCVFPYTEVLVGGTGYCLYPCSSSQYINFDGTCISSCEAPFTTSNGIYGEQFCNLPCPPLEYYYPASGICKPTCPQAAVIEDDIYLRCLPTTGGEPEDGLLNLLVASDRYQVPTLLVLTKLTQYVSFLDSTLPPRLYDVAINRGRSVLMMDLGIRMPNALKKQFGVRTLPAVFSRLEIHGSFLVNFWGDLMVIIIILLIGGLFKGIQMVSSRLSYERVDAIFNRLSSLFLVNFTLVLFAVYANDIMLYSYLDVSNMNLNAPIDTVSIFTGMLFFLLLLAVPGLGIFVIIKHQAARAQAIKERNAEKYINFRKKWGALQVFYTSSKEDTIPQRFFSVIYLARIIIPGLASLVLWTMPLTHCVIQTNITFIMILYLLIVSPLRKGINAVQLLLIEAMTFIVNIASLGVAAVDISKTPSAYRRIILGDMIIVGTICINLVILIMLVVKIVKEIREILKRRSEFPEHHDRGEWGQLAVILFQQAAYGFEEMSEKPEEVNFDFDGKKAAALEKVKESAKQEKPFVKIDKLSKIAPEPLALDVTRSQLEAPSVLLGVAPSFVDFNSRTNANNNTTVTAQNKQKNVFKRLQELRDKSSKQKEGSPLQEDGSSSPIKKLNSPTTENSSPKAQSAISIDMSPNHSGDKKMISPGKESSSKFNFNEGEYSPVKRSALDRLSRHMTIKK